MGWELSVVSLVVFASAAVTLAVGMVALRKRPDPMAWPLAALMFAATAWAVPHGISFGYTGAEQVAFWHRMRYPGTVLAPVAYFVVALRYAGHDRWLSRRTYALLGTVPAITVLFVWTNGAHGLFWRSVSTETVAGATVLVAEFGPWYFLNLGYLYLLTVATLFVLGSVAVGSEPLYRKQSGLMFVGGLVPLAVNVAFNTGIAPAPPVDFTTTAFAVTGLTFATVLFRYDFLDLSPAAYRNVSDLFGDGVLVFDGEGRLVEANDHAERVLGTSLEPRTPVGEVFDEPFEDLDGTVLTPPDEGRRFYELRYAPLRDQREVAVGHAVVMREVTDLKEHEQRLSVTNRVLRHNIRNELNVVLGQAESLDARLPGEHAELDWICEAATRLNDASEKARYIQSSMQLDRESLTAVDIVPVVESVVDRHRERAPDAEITLKAPDSLAVRATDPEPLEVAVDNVVENAVEHNDREPTVEVTVRATEEVTVRIADDGPGIPEAERKVILDGAETQLEHASGLGLWLVYWLVTAVDGSVTFEDNEPRGTVAVLRFRPA